MVTLLFRVLFRAIAGSSFRSSVCSSFSHECDALNKDLRYMACWTRAKIPLLLESGADGWARPLVSATLRSNSRYFKDTRVTHGLE